MGGIDGRGALYGGPPRSAGLTLTHQLAKVLAGLVLGDAVNGVWIGHVHEATKREALEDHEDHVLVGVIDHLEQPNYMGAAT